MTAKEQEKKRNIKSIEFNDYLLKEASEIINAGDFSNLSDITKHALTEFMVKYNLEKEHESVLDILIKMLETPEGKAAFDKVTKKEQSPKITENDSFYFIE